MKCKVWPYVTSLFVDDLFKYFKVIPDFSTSLNGAAIIYFVAILIDIIPSISHMKCGIVNTGN